MVSLSWNPIVHTRVSNQTGHLETVPRLPCFVLVQRNCLVPLSMAKIRDKQKSQNSSVPSRVGIGYPKFGYPRVIPGPEPNFGYGLGWVCVWIPWVFSGWVPIKFKILGFFGYYPWVPMRIGYPKFGHLRVIPEINYGKKCSFSLKNKYH